MISVTQLAPEAARVALGGAAVIILAREFKRRPPTVDIQCLLASYALAFAAVLVLFASHLSGSNGREVEPMAILVSTLTNALTFVAALFLMGAGNPLGSLTWRETIKLATLFGTVFSSLAAASTVAVGTASLLDGVVSGATIAFVGAQLGRGFVVSGRAWLANLTTVASVGAIGAQSLYFEGAAPQFAASVSMLALAWLYTRRGSLSVPPVNAAAVAV